MNTNQIPYLKRFVVLYFSTFLLVGIVATFCLYQFADVSWIAPAVLFGVLTAFGLLGVALTYFLGSGLVKPLKNIVSYTANILDGNYRKADDEMVTKTIPGLGDLVGELAAQFKERLGFSRSVLEGLPVPVCIVDTEERITFLNRECLEMLGSHEDPKSYYGKMISQIFYKDDRKSLIGTCMEENSRVMGRDAVFKHADGSDINAILNLFPLTDVEDTVIGGCCLYLDTTVLKKREQEIVCQNERIAKAASEATLVSEELAAAASQLESLVSEAQTGACMQTDRTSETATAMEEMNATVLEVARHAQEAAENADDARTQAEAGSQIVTDVVSSIEEVASHANELKASMEELDKSADGIGTVLSVIEDIADQTNLLALNAAIEAARAGEAGRGFAVVADEVRKLAEKTMQATSEVHEAITRIQGGARNNVHATEIAVSSVQKSTENAHRSGEALKRIVMVAESTADQVRAIATAAEQQSATSDEINRATADVTRVCNETDSLMNEATESITRLSKLASKLSTVIRDMQ